MLYHTFIYQNKGNHLISVQPETGVKNSLEEHALTTVTKNKHFTPLLWCSISKIRPSFYSEAIPCQTNTAADMITLDFHWILEAYSLTCTWKIYRFSFLDKIVFKVGALWTTWVKSATYVVTLHTHTHNHRHDAMHQLIPCRHNSCVCALH
jgi:hypothetical protein